MKWIEERDALIAQTKAFVEAVARRSADTGRSGARPVTRPVPRDAVVPNSVQPLTAAPPAKIQQTTREAPSEPAAPPASRRFDQVSMTTEIRARIAAFRAHQERFNRERHEYFNATLARLRAEIDELPPAAGGLAGAADVRRPDSTPSPMPAAGVQPRRPQP
ncbi:hypothetical protein [Bradyrhizobium sp.]|jgi:hypothetical protein|uniref:hypothetical protein n=1 Tax=Bradyrhizobium sp. TaxID=376 RepID=UPI002D1CB845|nr:hypothetical protein [Bradyrhizobium sp.]HWX57600.1 hypothetical protein [Bradyrhizobium sp.]